MGCEKINSEDMLSSPVRVTVCLCTYNGEKFVREQIISILNQLGSSDEIVVCDDRSTDETVNIAKSFEDVRIRIFVNEKNLGHVRNFERSLFLAKGRYIFLSDQDDVWTEGRLINMLNLMNEKPDSLLLASNFDLIDEAGSIIGNFRKLGRVHKSRILQVTSIFLGRSPYYGCTFLLHNDFLRFCLPIPKYIESHDIWMALVASSMGRVVNMSEVTLRHRIHGNNATSKMRRAFIVIFISRMNFLFSLIIRILRIKFLINRGI